MYLIPISNGTHWAMVDNEDFEMVNDRPWHKLVSGRTGKRKRVYATCKIKSRRAGMHELILGVKGGDHKNGDTLNNTRGNLRAATPSQNNYNQRLKTHYAGRLKASRFKGVSIGLPLADGTQRWRAYITYDKKMRFLGNFLSEQSAAMAYNAAAVKYFGEFAKLNEIEDRP